MGLFDDLFHSNKQRRNAEGRANNERMNQGAPDPYGGSYTRDRPNSSDYWSDAGGGVRGRFDKARYDADMAAYENSYQKNQVTFDDSGRPVLNGKPIERPGAETALDYQYLAEQEAERRRNNLWGDAQNQIRQGLDLFQSYRPGGSAALASGMFNQSASMYGTQALNTFAPDMLSEYREKQLQDEKRERDRARKFSQNMAMAQFGMNPLGLFNSGPTPQPDAPTPSTPAGPNGQPSAPTAPGGGGAVQAGPAAGAQVAGGASGGIMPMGGGGAGGMIPGGAYGAQIGPDGRPMSSNVRGTGGGPTVDGGFGAGGSPGGPVGGGGGGGSRVRGSGGPAGGPGGGIGGGGGGGGPISTFTGQEVATRGQSMSPIAADAASASWAESPIRSESVVLRTASARSALTDAIGLASNPVGGLVSLLI